MARAGLGPANLVLYDVSTRYLETVLATGSGSRIPRERRLEPQITIGLLSVGRGSHGE